MKRCFWRLIPRGGVLAWVQWSEGTCNNITCRQHTISGTQHGRTDTGVWLLDSHVRKGPVWSHLSLMTAGDAPSIMRHDFSSERGGRPLYFGSASVPDGLFPPTPPIGTTQ